MKRIIALIVVTIVISLALTACDLFEESADDGQHSAEQEIPGDGVTEEQPDGDNEKDPSDKTEEDTEDDNDFVTDEDAGDSAESITLDEYIKSLIDSEYCSDEAFLSFVAEMDDRTVGNIIYASPEGEGEGEIDDPASIYDAIDMAKPGDTVYLRGGEYISTEAIWLSNSGRADAYITIKSYPGENAVITTTPENIDKYDDGGEYLFFAFDEGTSYIIFEDLEIRSATHKYVGAFVCYDGGQNHLIFKNIKIHDLHTTKTKYDANAFLFMGEKKNPISNVMLIGNECYDLTLGYSEAISFAGNCEYCYVIDNRVYDVTNIGIDFYGNAGYCSDESLDQTRYCVAAYNIVYNCNSPYADCAGIYVDGGRNCLIEGNLVYNCQYGIEIGSEEKNDKYPVTDITVRNNILRENSVCAMRIGGYDTKTSGTVLNCCVYNNSFADNGGSNIIISKVDNIIFANNIFVSDKLYIETEFGESYINNLKFYNNCFNREGNNLALYGDEINIAGLNSLFGADNFSHELTVDENGCPNKGFVGCKDYSPKYDFNLCVREFYCIGAVDRTVE